MIVTLLTVFVSDCRTTSDFKCDNNLCLPKSVMCDGYDQCGDGSDENELCGASLSFCFLSVFVFPFPSIKPFIKHSTTPYDPL